VDLGLLNFEVSGIALRHTTLGGTRLDEWSSLRRDLCLRTHTNHDKIDTYVFGGIRSHSSIKEHPHISDRAATGIGSFQLQGVCFKSRTSVTEWLWTVKCGLEESRDNEYSCTLFILTTDVTYMERCLTSKRWSSRSVVHKLAKNVAATSKF